MNGQGSLELALESWKNKSWKNDKMHFFLTFLVLTNAMLNIQVLVRNR